MDPAQAQRILESFVQFLCARKDVIAEEWASSVRRSGRLQSPEGLTPEELRLHLPALFDDLADVLLTPMGKGVQNQADKDARHHGQQRFIQNYRLNELVREIAMLRTAFITQTIAFEDHMPDFHGMVKRVSLQRLHGFFDNMLADAAEQFTHEQQGGLQHDLATARENTTREREGRLEVQTDLRAAEAESEQLREMGSERLHLLHAVGQELHNIVDASRAAIHDLECNTDPATQAELRGVLRRNYDRMEVLLKDLLK